MNALNTMNASTGARSSPVEGARADRPERPDSSDATRRVDDRPRQSSDSFDIDDAAVDAGDGNDHLVAATSEPVSLPHGPEASLLMLGMATIVAGGADPGEVDLPPANAKHPPPEVDPPMRSDAALGGGVAAHAPTLLRGDSADGAFVDARTERAEVAPRAGATGMRPVERGLQALLQQRGGTLVMRLSPPELGALEIRMTLEAGRVEVLFRPSNGSARQLLDGNLGMLRQSLERHGVGVGRLVVEPPIVDRAEDQARSMIGSSFDAGGRPSAGRQEAERELRWRTEASLLLGRTLRPDDNADSAAEGRVPCPPSNPPPLRKVSSPVATAS